MFNNPYLNNFGGYREPSSQQPIQNIINTQMPNNSMFMARFLKEGESPQEIFVNTKTALISLSQKKLHIKETDGTITSYDIVLPLDEKDKKIIALEGQINELKEMIANVPTTSTIEANTEFTELNGDSKKHGKK